MKKRLKIICGFLVVILALTFTACGGGSGSGRTFTDVLKVEDWLANQKGGASPDDPIPFSVRQNLQNMAAPESNWHKLLTSINTAGLYVALDLSGSTMPGTEFDADGGITAGKKFIVSLVLPDSAESVKGVLWGNIESLVLPDNAENVPGLLCGYFENLKTVKARNIEYQIIEYLIGTPGPAGGFVFYDKGKYSDGWRYLEAAPVEIEFVAQWGAYGQNVNGTEKGLGTGKRNTELIVAHLNSRGETGRAAQVCADLSVSGFNDWFLPSSDELDLIYQNLRRNNIGGFTNNWYWSSSQIAYNSAWAQGFGNGNPGNGAKHGEGSIRAVRAF